MRRKYELKDYKLSGADCTAVFNVTVYTKHSRSLSLSGNKVLAAEEIDTHILQCSK